MDTFRIIHSFNLDDRVNSIAFNYTNILVSGCFCYGFSY